MASLPDQHHQNAIREFNRRMLRGLEENLPVRVDHDAADADGADIYSGMQPAGGWVVAVVRCLHGCSHLQSGCLQTSRASGVPGRRGDQRAGAGRGLCGRATTHDY
jgi:hypothetical protein